MQRAICKPWIEVRERTIALKGDWSFLCLSCLYWGCWVGSNTGTRSISLTTWASNCFGCSGYKRAPSRSSLETLLSLSPLSYLLSCLAIPELYRTSLAPSSASSTSLCRNIVQEIIGLSATSGMNTWHCSNERRTGRSVQEGLTCRNLVWSMRASISTQWRRKGYPFNLWHRSRIGSRSSLPSRRLLLPWSLVEWQSSFACKKSL